MSLAIFLARGDFMNEKLNELIDKYRDSKISNLLMLTRVMSYATITCGIMEFIRTIHEWDALMINPFFKNNEVDTAMSLCMIALGILLRLSFEKSTVYRKIILALICFWSYIAIFYLIDAIMGNNNLYFIIILPIISQLVYMMKASVFLDGTS